MEAEVVSISRDRSCHARLGNDVLVAFPAPTGWLVAVGDRIRLEGLLISDVVRVTNSSRGTASLDIRIAATDIHDLRKSAAHGTSRTPTLERLYAV
jgi:hypothetical protein